MLAMLFAKFFSLFTGRHAAQGNPTQNAAADQAEASRQKRSFAELEAEFEECEFEEIHVDIGDGHANDY